MQFTFFVLLLYFNNFFINVGTLFLDLPFYLPFYLPPDAIIHNNITCFMYSTKIPIWEHSPEPTKKPDSPPVAGTIPAPGGFF